MAEVFEEIDLSPFASSLKQSVLAFIEDNLTDEQRQQFRQEIQAVLETAPPADIDTTDPRAASRIMDVSELFVRTLRAWHVSVVVHSDPSWMEEIANGEGGDLYTTADLQELCAVGDVTATG